MILGCDPGLSHAPAFPSTPTTIETVDMPVHLLSRGRKAKRELDIAELIQILALRRISHAFVEAVSSMPGQGVSSIFAFGKCYGVILGVIASRIIRFRWFRRPAGSGFSVCQKQRMERAHQPLSSFPWPPINGHSNGKNP
jgi:crossover junction endodeoxyribonuclease RuvC